MSDMDKVILDLFKSRWTGESVIKDINSMKAQLFKNLNDQINGYWSGHTAYSIMVDGGFLKDVKSGQKKELTSFGRLFVNGINEQLRNNNAS